MIDWLKYDVNVCRTTQKITKYFREINIISNVISDQLSLQNLKIKKFWSLILKTYIYFDY